MYKVELKDFNKYVPLLTQYAIGLLRSKGNNICFSMEVEDKANDIVQNTYIKFHNYNSLDSFVDERHLINFLKQCLYWEFKECLMSRNRIVKYDLTKDWNNDLYSDNVVNLSSESFNDYFDIIDKFIDILTDKQKNIINKVIIGYSQIEISNELNISRQAVNDSMSKIRGKYIEYARNSKI